MKRLYQWLSERTSFFRYDAIGPGTSSTIHTETTIRREGMTLLVGSATAGFDICPLCGNMLASVRAEQRDSAGQRVRPPGITTNEF